MKRFIGVLLIICVLGFIGCTEKNEKTEIGIIQIVEHPALDDAREGFIKALEDNGFDLEKVNIDYQNAQGDMTTSQTISERFKSEKKDLVLAIATPTAQTMFNVLENSDLDTKLAITAVTDPVEAGLIKEGENGSDFVFGTSDKTPIDKQIDLIKKILPETRKIGVLYNTSEQNSLIQIEWLESLAKENNMSLELKGVTNVNEVAQALESILSNIDILYVPTDNVIASAMPILAKKCNEKKIPIIGSEKAHVEQGALATEGISYFKLGYQTGEMAVEVLKGKDVRELKIETLKETECIINKEVVELLELSISDEFEDKIVTLDKE